MLLAASPPARARQGRLQTGKRTGRAPARKGEPAKGRLARAALVKQAQHGPARAGCACLSAGPGPLSLWRRLQAPEVSGR